jgi:hypothetical protein
LRRPNRRRASCIGDGSRIIYVGLDSHKEEILYSSFRLTQPSGDTCPASIRVRLSAPRRSGRNILNGVSTLKQAEEGDSLDEQRRAARYSPKLERGDIVIAAKLDRLFRSAVDAAVRRSTFRSVPRLQRVQTSARSRLEPGTLQLFGRVRSQTGLKAIMWKCLVRISVSFSTRRRSGSWRTGWPSRSTEGAFPPAPHSSPGFSRNEDSGPKPIGYRSGICS